MNAAFYNRAQRTALKLISDKGSQWSVTRQVDAVFGDDGSYNAGGVLDQTVNAVKIPVGKSMSQAEEKWSSLFVTGKMIKLIVACKNLDWIPNVNDVFERNGESWIVRGATNVDPDGTPIIATLFLEKTQ
jgi:hypothetical protein